jgi:DNA-binding NarL/FixJ family response regulator
VSWGAPPAGRPWRALFVDDEAEVLSALAARSRKYRRDWSINTAVGGPAGLSALAGPEPYDLVVTDLSMPKVSGVEILAEARKVHPRAARFVLSGRSDQKMASHAILAHQIFGKPSELEEILRRASLALAVGARLEPGEVERVTSGEGIPKSPKVFAALHTALRSESYEPRMAAKIVEQDINLTGRVLRIASASPLGPRRSVTSVRAALVALGRDAVEQLVLLEETLSSSSGPAATSQMRDHALAVARIGMRLEPGLDGVFTAGVLHDVGLLLQGERDLPGGRHPELGAYLAALWGFPPPVVEAVLFHHDPPPNPPLLTGTVWAAERIAEAGRQGLDGAESLVGAETAARWSQAALSLTGNEPHSLARPRPGATA